MTLPEIASAEEWRAARIALLAHENEIIQHFMFDPSWEDGCSSCTAASDELSDGLLSHLHARGTTWLGGSYAFLDLTALGRQEDWEEPKGRADVVRGAVPDFST